MDLAVQRQATGNALDRPAQMAQVWIEQAVGIDAALVQRQAGHERVFQLIAIDAGEQVLALHQ
ncbi:hypothetical protein D3C71_2190770 [compost metagenome]